MDPLSRTDELAKTVVSTGNCRPNVDTYDLHSILSKCYYNQQRLIRKTPPR